MEEALFAQALDLVVDPVQQGGVALAHSGGNGILAAQRGDADCVAGVLLCKSDDLGVVVGPCYAIAVFQRVLGGCIGIILLQGNVGIFLGQVGLGGGAGLDGDGLADEVSLALNVRLDLLDICVEITNFVTVWFQIAIKKLSLTIS